MLRSERLYIECVEIVIDGDRLDDGRAREDR